MFFQINYLIDLHFNRANNLFYESDRFLKIYNAIFFKMLHANTFTDTA